MRSRGRWQQCEPCRTRTPHDPAACLGRDAGCTCRWCPGRWASIIADAAALCAPTPTEAELLRIAEVKYGREIRARAYRRWQPVCAGPGCGRQVGALKFGRMRRYCSPACRQRSYRARRRERLREAELARQAERASRAAERAASWRPETAAGNDRARPGNAPEARPAVPLPAWIESALGEGEPGEVLGPPTAAERRRWRTPASTRN
jgi:hypothetical protein